MPKRIDLSGKKIGLLTALHPITSFGAKKLRWLCVCECGQVCRPVSEKLLHGQTKSCGCYRKNFRRKYDPITASAKKIFDGSYSDGDITFDQFLCLSQKRCHYCNALPSNKNMLRGSCFIYNGLDRVDSHRSHTMDNIVTCCKICNYAKHNLSKNDFLLWVQRIYKHCIEGR